MQSSSGERSLYVTFVALMILLAATMGCSFLLRGGTAIWVAFTIAMLKMALVTLVFMNLRRETVAVRFAAVGGLLWFLFALIGVLADYNTRGLNEVPTGGLEESQRISTYERFR